MLIFFVAILAKKLVVFYVKKIDPPNICRTKNKKFPDPCFYFWLGTPLMRTLAKKLCKHIILSFPRFLKQWENFVLHLLFFVQTCFEFFQEIGL